MHLDEIEFILKAHPMVSRNLLMQAFALCKNHEKAVFLSNLLVKARLGYKVILAAILLDVSETKIKQIFGEEILRLVHLTKQILNIEIPPNIKKTFYNEVTTMLVALAKDLRVIFLIITLAVYKLEFEEKIEKDEVRNILNYIVPLAYRLNVWHLKTRIEDLCLQRLKPEKYIAIERRLNLTKPQREAYMEKCLEILKGVFAETEIQIQASGRIKNIYSIYKKQELKKLSFEEIFDLIALRIVVDSVEDCYKALGVVHSLWLPKVERIKDYIAVPKPNNYKGLHSTVLGPDNHFIEIQIRTKEMHRSAEFGIAAHWVYANDKRSTIQKNKQPDWVKSLLNLQNNLQNQSLNLDDLHIRLAQRVIFVFTDDGQVVKLPHKACVVDLAFAMSSYTGNHLAGCNVNGKGCKPTQVLKSADVVKLNLAKKKLVPEKTWLRFVKTEKAQVKIKERLKKKKIINFVNLVF